MNFLVGRRAASPSGGWAVGVVSLPPRRDQDGEAGAARGCEGRGSARGVEREKEGEELVKVVGYAEMKEGKNERNVG